MFATPGPTSSGGSAAASLAVNRTAPATIPPSAATAANRVRVRGVEPDARSGPSRRADLRPRPDQRPTELISRTRAGNQETATACGRRYPTMASESPISPWLRICSAARSARPGRPTSTCSGMSPSRPPDRGHHPRQPRQRRRLDGVQPGPVPGRQRPDRRVRHASPIDDGTTGTTKISWSRPTRRATSRERRVGGSVRNPDSRLIRCRLARRIGHRISRMVRSRLRGT